MKSMKSMIESMVKVSAFVLCVFLFVSLTGCSSWGEWATMDDWGEEFESSDSESDSSDESTREGTEYGYKYQGTETDLTAFKVMTCGGMLSGNRSYYSSDGFTVTLGKDDVYSDFVDIGLHDVSVASEDAVGHSFDSVAVATGYKVTVYEGKSGSGDVLLETLGPAIVYNIKWKDHATFGFLGDLLTQDWSGRDSESGEYWRELFPSTVRTWSSSDMNSWKSGSIKVEQL